MYVCIYIYKNSYHDHLCGSARSLALFPIKTTDQKLAFVAGLVGYLVRIGVSVPFSRSFYFKLCVCVCMCLCVYIFGRFKSLLFKVPYDLWHSLIQLRDYESATLTSLLLQAAVGVACFHHYGLVRAAFNTFKKRQ